MNSISLENVDDALREKMREAFPAEVNVTIGNMKPGDIDLFFGPVLPHEIFVHTTETRFPRLLKALGCFPSTGQARGNGWDREIPKGWTHVTVGKTKLNIFILREFDPQE